MNNWRQADGSWVKVGFCEAKLPYTKGFCEAGLSHFRLYEILCMRYFRFAGVFSHAFTLPENVGDVAPLAELRDILGSRYVLGNQVQARVYCPPMCHEPAPQCVTSLPFSLFSFDVWVGVGTVAMSVFCFINEIPRKGSGFKAFARTHVTLLRLLAITVRNDRHSWVMCKC